VRVSLRSWLQDGDGLNWPAVLLLALVLVVGGATLVAASTSSSAFDPYNPAWDGTGDFREVIEADDDVEDELVRETDRYESVEAEGTTAIVLAPDEPYEGDDAARIQQFVEGGGTLVVLENFEPHANELLDDVGAEARTNGSVVLDQRYYERGPAMPIATGVAEHPRTAGVEQLSLNYATAVDPGNATVLVETSDYAYLGASADAELDDDADLGTHPVATVEDVGEGEVVTVGDPSLAINAMYGEPDNAAFLQRQYADDERVLLDVSRTTELPPLAAALVTVREWPALQAALGLLAVAAVAGTARQPVRPTLRRARRRLSRARGDSSEDGPGLSDTERAAVLRERYPDWDEERVQRVITALNRPQSKRGDE
jgi:hypothetical protein